MDRIRHGRGAVFGVALALAVLAAACTGEDRRRAVAVGQGFEIVQSLEAYRARHGSYPDSLRQLVPEFMPRLERPPIGAEKWSYRRLDPEDPADPGFDLTVPARYGDAAVLRFDWKAQRWMDAP